MRHQVKPLVVHSQHDYPLDFCSSEGGPAADCGQPTADAFCVKKDMVSFLSWPGIVKSPCRYLSPGHCYGAPYKAQTSARHRVHPLTDLFPFSSLCLARTIVCVFLPWAGSRLGV
jgi:hypothetical protein